MRTWQTGETVALRGMYNGRPWIVQSSLVVNDSPQETALLLMPGAECVMPYGYIHKKHGDHRGWERWQETLEGRISLALSHTGAELINWRRNGQRQAVVRYRLTGRRFECVIDTESLQIMDAGICLSGTDEELNLSSLPSAVREAIQSGQLHVFRNI